MREGQGRARAREPPHRLLHLLARTNPKGAADTAGIDHATFAGHDFGGPVALSLYRRAPQRFDGLALIATNAFPNTPIPFPLSSVTLPVIDTALARVLFSRPALAAMLRRCGGEQLGAAASVRSIFTRSLQGLAGLYAEYPHTLASVTGPASVVWGTT